MTIGIYKMTIGDGSSHYFKGIDDLRDFAKEIILDSWPTAMTLDDLKDDNNVIKFINHDYGEEVELLFDVSVDDLLNQIKIKK
jgi:hypothetical protein